MLQVAALEWLWGLWVKGSGGILGDDMGLGKTRTMSIFIAGLTPLPGSAEASIRRPITGMHAPYLLGIENIVCAFHVTVVRIIPALPVVMVLWCHSREYG